jgi:hypothetical protein
VSLQALVALEAYFRSIMEGIECRIEHIILYIQNVLYSVLRASGVSMFEREKIPAPTESKRRAKDSKVVAVYPLFLHFGAHRVLLQDTAVELTFHRSS